MRVCVCVYAEESEGERERVCEGEFVCSKWLKLEKKVMQRLEKILMVLRCVCVCVFTCV